MMLEKEEQQRLAEVIRQWNNNRLDLFEISQPDEVRLRKRLLVDIISVLFWRTVGH